MLAELEEKVTEFKTCQPWDIAKKTALAEEIGDEALETMQRMYDQLALIYARVTILETRATTKQMRGE